MPAAMTSPPQPVEESTPPELADPESFRDPTPREHWLAAGLFVGFGGFFVLLFFVTAGFWFRWVTLGLGVYSILNGVRHVGYAVRGTSR
jgi:hypothetical protein